jgi:hypothetical protein
MIAYDGEEKHLHLYRCDTLNMELLIPFRPGAQPTEYSSLLIRRGRLKIFEIRWDKTGPFKVVTFKPGEWEQRLRALALH